MKPRFQADADLHAEIVAGVLRREPAVDFQSAQERLGEGMAGIAAACGEQWDAAEEHYRTGLHHAHALPHRMLQPELRRWYARMLVDRDRPGDHDRALTMLGEAVEMYHAIGMPRHVEMAQDLMNQL